MRPLVLGLLLLLGSRPAPVTDLDAVADRLGGRERFDAMAAFRLVADVEAAGPAGEVALRSTLSVQLPDAGLPEAVRIRQELPSGTVTTVWADGAVRTRAAGVTRVLRPEAARRLRAQLHHTLPYLLARRDALVLDRLAWEGDDTILTLRAPRLPETIRLVIGPDGLPASVSTVLEGAEVSVAFSRYQRASGLLLPFSSVQTVDGAVSGTATLASVEVDPALPDALFSLD